MLILFFLVFQDKSEFLIKQGYSNMSEMDTRDNAYEGLRNLALHVKGTVVGAAAKDPEQPYGIVTDIGFPSGTATVVAMIDGTASVYLSSGGGYIGGIGHQSIREAAIRAANAAHDVLHSLHQATHFPLPGPGLVSFRVLTARGVFVDTVREDSLEDPRAPLHRLYAAVQDVITQYRLIND